MMTSKLLLTFQILSIFLAMGVLGDDDCLVKTIDREKELSDLKGDEKFRILNINKLCVEYLDGSELQVQRKPVDLQNKGQIWKLIPADDGAFIIENTANSKVLDARKGVKEGAEIITYKKHGRENQQWFINKDGNIENAAKRNLVITVKKDGLYLEEEKDGDVNQIFIFSKLE